MHLHIFHPGQLRAWREEMRKCARNFPNLPFVSILVCIRAWGGHYQWLLLWAPVHLEFNIRSEVSVIASHLSTASTYPTLSRNRNLKAKLEELICGHHVFICVKLFFCSSWKYCHWIFRLLLCRSFGPRSEVYLRVFSSALLERSAWGGKGSEGGIHIQGCTLMITVVFPLKRVFCFVDILFSCVFLISQLKQPYPLPLQSSGRSNFVYIKLVFCIHKRTWSTFLIV